MSEENLTKEIIDIYQSHAGPKVKFKDGDSFIHKVIKSENAPDRINTIVELLAQYPNVYFHMAEGIKKLFVENNFKYLDAKLFSALSKKTGQNAAYNGIIHVIYEGALKQLAKTNEIAPLVARPDLKDADSLNNLNTIDTGSYTTVPYSAPDFIKDTHYTLREIAQSLTSNVTNPGAVTRGLKLMQDASAPQLLGALSSYLERTKLEAIAQKNPLDNAARAAADASYKLSAAAIKAIQAAQTSGKVIQDFIEWKTDEYRILNLAQKEGDLERIEHPNKDLI